MKITPTQAQVDESLDSAIRNGYELDDWSAADIAEDLNQYDSQFEEVPTERLVALIQNWKDRR